MTQAMSMRRWRRSDFAFDLPTELIAQRPGKERAQSRLMALGEAGITHRRFDELPDLLSPGDLLAVNDTRVIKARLNGVKDSGGRAEILVERVEDDRHALCQVRSSKSLKAGRSVRVGNVALKVQERAGEFYRLEFPGGVEAVLECHGHVPLPPYIERPDDDADAERYQTVFARHAGAVAAPTAGLHFNEALLTELQTRGIEIAPVTLHVGAGTFQPMRVEDVSEHQMHAERYQIPPTTRQRLDACKGRIVAVGTTVVRTLEAAAATGNDADDTRLFITPGFDFRVVDALITNFHLPESTLLMLVSAFAGVEPVRNAYAEAVAERYRFFSYGDAMFCTRSGSGFGRSLRSSAS